MHCERTNQSLGKEYLTALVKYSMLNSTHGTQIGPSSGFEPAEISAPSAVGYFCSGLGAGLLAGKTVVWGARAGDGAQL